MERFLIYILPIIIVFCIVYWWTFMCKTYEGTFSPKRLHRLLFMIISLVPILNWFEAAILLVVYVASRITGSIVIKENKFTNFLFK